MIVDAFTFFNEFDLLELRLNELKDVVDLFVLVEASRTFSGLPKPLHFADQRERFRDFPIAHVTVLDMPNSVSPWDREHWQRNAIMRGLETVPGHATVMVSDVDEIPRASVVLLMKDWELTTRDLAFLEQDFFYYDFHTRAVGVWFGTRACLCDALRQPGWGPQAVRDRGTAVVPNGGWHFSYTGGTEAIRTKVAAFSHQEYNNDHWMNPLAIMKKVDEGRDLFNRPDMQFEQVPGVSHLPKYVQEHPDKFWKMLKEAA